MSNGKLWESHIEGDGERKLFQDYIRNQDSAKSYSRLLTVQIPLDTLIRDTDFEKYPSAEWYALHTCVNDRKKWRQRIIAFGLNVHRKDLYSLQRNIVSLIMEKRRKASKRKIVEKLDDLPLEDLSKRIIVAWESMAPRFDVVLVPCPWFITAVQEFANSCKSSSKRMLDLGFYDRHTGELTELGKKNWDALYRSAVSPDEPFRSALAIMGGRNKAPTCPPCINCIPNEMVAEILNHAFESHREVDGNTRNVVIGQGLPGLATANKWLHENSLSWISRQAVTIRVRSWPPKGFREGHLPVQFLQTVRKVHFDLDGLSYSDRKVIHPAMRQLAKIWTEKDELQSLTLSVGPDYEKLLLENPRLQFDADMKNAFSPLSGIPGNKLHYVFDFRAPVVPYGANALCAIAALREDSSSEKCLQFILEKSKDLINTPSGTYGCVPLHYAAQSIGDRSARRLLAMKGIDVNYKNDKDHTPLHEALTTCNARMMILLADNEKIIITEELVVDTVNRLSRTDVLTALYRRMENPPSWLEDFLSRRLSRELSRSGS